MVAVIFNQANANTEQQIALDKQQEDLLQGYLDKMSELLLEKQLQTNPLENVRNVARVRTITVLFQLDARRIGYVFAFLRDADLMSANAESIISLKQANLSKINFSRVTIQKADLRDTNLGNANFSGADLSGADLKNARLNSADLRNANLSAHRSLKFRAV